jgi:hypothetical protein
LYFLIFPCRNDDRQPIHGIAKLALANMMMDYVACPLGGDCCPGYRRILDKWKLGYEERRPHFIK